MQVPKRQGDLCRVEFRLILGKALLLRKVLEELATLDKVHDEINSIGLLEHVVHSDDEWMVDLKQDQFLDFKRVYGVMLNDDVFSDDLHSVQPIVALAFNQENLTKSATTNAFNQFEVLKRRGDQCVTTVKQLGASSLTGLLQHTVKIEILIVVGRSACALD